MIENFIGGLLVLWSLIFAGVTVITIMRSNKRDMENNKKNLKKERGE